MITLRDYKDFVKMEIEIGEEEKVGSGNTDDPENEMEEHSVEVSHYQIDIFSEEIVAKVEVTNDRAEVCETDENLVSKEFQFVGVLSSAGTTIDKIEDNGQADSSQEEDMNFPLENGFQGEEKDPLELPSHIKNEIKSEDFEENFPTAKKSSEIYRILPKDPSELETHVKEEIKSEDFEENFPSAIRSSEIYRILPKDPLELDTHVKEEIKSEDFEEMKFPLADDSQEEKPLLEFDSHTKDEVMLQDFVFKSVGPSSIDEILRFKIHNDDYDDTVTEELPGYDLFFRSDLKQSDSSKVIKRRVSRRYRENISAKLRKTCALPAVMTEEDAVNFFRERGLLHKTRKCDNGHDMKFRMNGRFRWSCSKALCGRYIQIRSNTWFAGSTLDFMTIVFFIYVWCNKNASIKFCRKNLKIDDNTTGAWSRHLRDVCMASILNNPLQIGGPGLTVEIYMCVFLKMIKKGKYSENPNEWVFGGYCEETKESFMFVVKDRSAATLKPIIEQYIIPGTTIFSDKQVAFRNIGKMLQYDHVTVRHQTRKYVHLDDTDTESEWHSAKHTRKLHCCTGRNHVSSYLAEFMWRQRNFCNDLFDTILQDIADSMPLT